MSDALNKLEGQLLAICPQCKGRANECRTCYDYGYVKHGAGCQPIALDYDPEVAQALNELRDEKQ